MKSVLIKNMIEDLGDAVAESDVPIPNVCPKFIS